MAMNPQTIPRIVELINQGAHNDESEILLGLLFRDPKTSGQERIRDFLRHVVVKKRNTKQNVALCEACFLHFIEEYESLREFLEFDSSHARLTFTEYTESWAFTPIVLGLLGVERWARTKKLTFTGYREMLPTLLGYCFLGAYTSKIEPSSFNLGIDDWARGEFSNRFSDYFRSDYACIGIAERERRDWFLSMVKVAREQSKRLHPPFYAPSIPVDRVLLQVLHAAFGQLSIEEELELLLGPEAKS